MEQVQSRELHRRPVRSAVVRVRLYLHSSLCLVRCRMCRPVRTVVEPERSSKTNARIAAVPVYIASKKKIQVSIPAGIDNGQSVRIREKGEPGINGGPRGDLLVEVVVSRHPTLQRQDMNIYSTAPISFAQAALGGEIRIHTVDGDVLYEVKPGTQTNTRIRLKGKGVPSLRNKSVRGDHYVDLVVQTPTGLSADAKEALRQFDALTGDSLNRTGAQDGAGSSDKQEKPKKRRDSWIRSKNPWTIFKSNYKKQRV